jgi:diguanylate cyclase (GGDEF)-like protein
MQERNRAIRFRGNSLNTANFSAVRQRAPRLTRINYLPRTLGFAATFVVISWLVTEQGWSLWNLPVGALCFLVYPHLVYLYGRYYQKDSRFERRAMAFDSVMLAYWSAHIEFSGWITFTLLACVVLNNTMAGGVRQCLYAIIWYIIGLLLSILINGFHWSPGAPLAIEITTMVALQLYIFIAALLFYSQAWQLMTTKKSAERKTAIFQSILILADQVERQQVVYESIDTALNELSKLYPNQSFGFILKNNRDKSIRFSVYTRTLTNQEREFVEQMTLKLEDDQTKDIRFSFSEADDNNFIFPLKERFECLQGFLLLLGPRMPDDEYWSIRLVIQHLGTSISNKLLTMSLEAAAERDALTGIYNRGHLDKELESASVRVKQNDKRQFAVILIDIIGLKRINDHYGHTAGDQLICALAEALKATCREQDKLFRYGGDEFVILCEEDVGLGAPALVRRIEETVKRQKVTLKTDQNMVLEEPLCFSVGIATTEQVPPEDVMKLADKRMYQDKQRWYELRERYR